MRISTQSIQEIPHLFSTLFFLRKTEQIKKILQSDLKRRKSKISLKILKKSKINLIYFSERDLFYSILFRYAFWKVQRILPIDHRISSNTRKKLVNYLRDNISCFFVLNPPSFFSQENRKYLGIFVFGMEEFLSKFYEKKIIMKQKERFCILNKIVLQVTEHFRTI